MNETVPLGRIAGVRVGLHWSVVGIFLLVAVGLGAFQLPSVFPGHAAAAYALGGIAAALMLVISLLCHEMAHAIVARRNRVAVEGITLWLLGGVARLRGEARGPAADLRIAAVGPLASAALAAVFAALMWLGLAVDGNELVVAVLGYLALLNLALAVFNLIPAAPLDGGRVLRAVLWWLRGDRFRAAVWSARAGRLFGFALIVAGLVQLFTRGGTGLWWVLLGLFIVTVAAAEEQHAKVGVALADVRVRDVMSTPVEVADGDLAVERFLSEVALHRAHSAFPLLRRDGGLEGLVTLGRLRRLSGTERSTRTLREVSCPADRVPVAEPDEPLALVLSRLGSDGDGRIVVHSGGDVIGIVSPSDISRTVAEHGLRVSIPGGADLSWDNREPPAGWWYPGQRR